MTSTPASSAPPKTDASKTPLWVAAEANEWGQLTGLEPHAQYFVVRRPTPELTRERSMAFVEDVKAFLHEQRVLAERQAKELQEKYGEPAKARIQEFRSTLEKRFDELAKDIESRVDKLEHDLNERGILRNKPAKDGTPGEMPMEGPAEPASRKKSVPK
jgi:hypothetical protein